MHCKDVSVRDMDVPISLDSISEFMDGRAVYTRTEYMVFRHGEDHAVVKLEKGDGQSLFKVPLSYEVLSLPSETVFVDDPDTDVLNTPAMARLQSEHPGKTVVVRGMFSHINFVKDLQAKRLRVIDNVPPSPSKLSVLTKIALDSGFVDHPIVVESMEIDMSEQIGNVTTDAVMFPCRVSGLKADIPYYFLDDVPLLDEEVTLIGCNLSRRIYAEVYGKDTNFINVCPADNIIDDGVKTIVKCCKVKTGHVKEGNTVTVPWGATVPEIVGALNDLFSE